MNPYRAGDGRWFFLTGLEAERHIAAVCRALGRPDLLDDPRFADAAAIRRHRTEVIAILDEIIAQRPLAEWAERFDAGRGLVGAGPDPGRGGRRSPAGGQRRLRRGRRGRGRGLRSVNGPVSFSDVRPAAPGGCPPLGEHTERGAGRGGRPARSPAAGRPDRPGCG